MTNKGFKESYITLSLIEAQKQEIYLVHLIDVLPEDLFANLDEIEAALIELRRCIADLRSLRISQEKYVQGLVKNEFAF
jgi:hypothetical protein